MRVAWHRTSVLFYGIIPGTPSRPHLITKPLSSRAERPDDTRTVDMPEKKSRKLSFADFLQWEEQTHDVLDFKKIYVDMAGDLLAGIVLSELVYWYLPAKDGGTRLRVKKRGRMWIAARRWEWWDRCRMTPRQSDRALGILVKAALFDKALFRFDGEPTIHVALNEKAFLDAWAECLDRPKMNPFLPEGKADSPAGEADSPGRESDLTSRAIPLTKTTAENVTTPYIHSTADAEEGAVGDDFINDLDEDDPDIALLADAFADLAGLRPIPVKGDAKCADWLKDYKQLLSICLNANLDPPELALLCAMKREELGFLAGRPGAYVKTAQNVAVALTDADQRRAVLWQLNEYINTRVSPEKREAWRQWIG